MIFDHLAASWRPELQSIVYARGTRFVLVYAVAKLALFSTINIIVYIITQELHTIAKAKLSNNLRLEGLLRVAYICRIFIKFCLSVCAIPGGSLCLIIS